MLSAVENFGPLLGPAVALSHAHQHAHPAHSHTHVHAHSHTHAQAREQAHSHLYAHVHSAPPVGGYVINVATEASGAPAISPSSVSAASLSPAQLTSQLNALQQQFQQQYEQHLNSYLTSAAQPTLSRLSVALPNSVSTALLNDLNANENAVAANLSINSSNKQTSKYHTHKSRSNAPSSSAIIGRDTKFFNSGRLIDNSTMMSINEFTPPPNPKHHHNLESNQSGPMNLVTSSNNTFTGSNLPLSNNIPSTADSSRPSSSSSSVDVENDESISPISIPSHSRKQSNYSDSNASSAAAAVVAAYQFNYSQLYQARPPASIYNTPVIFPTNNTPHVSLASHSGVVHSHVPPFLSSISTHAPISPGDASVYSAEYLKALQSAVAVGAFPPGVNQHVLQNPALTTNSVQAKSRLRSPASSMSPLAHTDQIPNPMVSPLSQDERTNTTRLSTGTYLYDKVKTSPSDVAETETFFKIPSGKEGSLKHRILTRPPSLDKTEANKTFVMRTHSTTSIFKKGSYIELSNGTIRRVEDMRTEDFIQCAERSLQHQLIESTVVKINTNSPHIVVIAFSYDRNRSKVDIEVSPDHPFFVYGQGWASCNPESSFKAFGLKCQRLQVGDICISLSKRDTICNNNSGSSKTSYAPESEKSIKIQQSSETFQLERDLQPLALTDSSYARQFKVGAQFPTMRSSHSAMHFLPPPQLRAPPIYSVNADSYPGFYQPMLHIVDGNGELSQEQLQRRLQQLQQPQLQPQKESAEQRDLNNSREEVALSRKRRWSAPESFSNSDDDDDEQLSQPARQKSAPTSVSSTTYLAYGPKKLCNAEANCDSTTTFK